MTRPLNKREQKKLMRKATEVKNRRVSTISVCGFFLSLFLWIYPYVQYHWTIIDYKIPLSIFIFSGVLLGWLIKNYLTHLLKQNMFKASLIVFMFFAGNIFTSIFFLINNLFSETDLYYIKAPIVDVYETSMKGGRNKGIAVDVELLKFTKRLHFPLEDLEEINNANFVLLDVSKGGLGFEVIRDRTPIK